VPQARPAARTGTPHLDGVADGGGRLFASGFRSWQLRQRYVFSLRSDVSVDFGSAASAIDYVLTGKTEVRVVDENGGRVTLHLLLPEASLKNRGGDLASLTTLAAEIMRADAVCVLADGQLTTFGFRKGVASPVVATFRQLAAALQVAYLGAGEEKTVEEYDTTGLYVAQYHAVRGQKDHLDKRKIRYVELLGRPLGPGRSPLQLVPEIVQSDGEIQLAPDGAPESVRLKDAIVLRSAQVPVRSSTSLVLQRASVGPSDSLPTADQLLAEFTLVPASEPDGPRVAVDALDKARTKGMTFQEIVGRIEKEQASPLSGVRQRHSKRKAPSSANDRVSPEETKIDAQLFASLAAALRDQQGAVGEAVRVISAKPAMSSVLTDALGSASCPACEAALIAMLDSSDPERRSDALWALSRLTRPGDMAVSTMKSILAKDPYNVSALYALGSYSMRFREDGKAGKASELGQYLVSALSAAPDSMRRTFSLRALENAGFRDSLPVVSRYLNDPDEGVRRAAILALRSINDPAVDDILASYLKKETPTSCRVAIIEAAKARQPSKKVAAAIAATFSSSVVNVRYRSVELLAQWLPREPHLRSFLQKISVSDPDQRIRTLAKGAL